MKTTAILAAATLLASAGTCAFAQAPVAPPQAGQEQGQGRPEVRRGMSQDDFNRFVDARIASIKAGLKLTADQERLWAPVETAIRNAASQRYDRMEQFRNSRDQAQSIDFMQRIERRATTMTQDAQNTMAVSTALRPLWDTLSEDQKRIAPRLMYEVVNNGMGWRKHGGRNRWHGRMMEHRRGERDASRGRASQQQ